jgi:GAF domain-containing protein
MSEGEIDLQSDGHGGRYRGSDALVERALAEGGPCFGPVASSPLLAAIPLTSQGDVVGILVIRKLLDHHTARLEEDRELLDLLAAHAASALLAARAYSVRDRKVRTLESLIRLGRGQSPMDDDR